ncbi:MAG: hypothetical protein U0575_07565 [Phycisphaerales bacterium]
MATITPAAIAATLAAVLAASAAPSASALVIGGFTVARGGSLAISGGTDLDDLRASINIALPGSTIVGAETLTSSFLAGIDVLFITSPRGGNVAITPLSAAEQAALLAFVRSGGSAVLCIDNDTFGGAASDPANESLLDPFGLDAAGTGPPWLQGATVLNPALSPITSGPFGVVNGWSVGWTGWFTTVPSNATVLGKINQNSLPGLVVLPRGSLAACSGTTVFFSDTTAFVDGFFGPGSPNDILMRNTFAFLGAPTCVSGLCGDIDANGEVDGADLGALLAAWGTSSVSADLDADGTVGGGDLGILLANWGPCSD